MIQFKTGRTYDAEQVLEITIEQNREDEFGIREITAKFVDASRNIEGRVNFVASAFTDIGKAVLEEYDAGQYTSI